MPARKKYIQSQGGAAGPARAAEPGRAEKAKTDGRGKYQGQVPGVLNSGAAARIQSRSGGSGMEGAEEK